MTDTDRDMLRLIADLDQRWEHATNFIKSPEAQRYSSFLDVIRRGDWMAIRNVADLSPACGILLSRLCVLAMDEINTRNWKAEFSQ